MKIGNNEILFAHAVLREQAISMKSQIILNRAIPSQGCERGLINCQNENMGCRIKAMLYAIQILTEEEERRGIRLNTKECDMIIAHEFLQIKMAESGNGTKSVREVEKEKREQIKFGGQAK